MDGVHHLEKLVDGVPLRRPWWFFDVRVQGRGIVDIPTHLVDRTQWLTERVAPTEVPRLRSARASTTRVPLASFHRITGEPDIPIQLRPLVDGDALDYACNAALELQIGAVVAHASARWELAVPPGGGDTSRLVAHGTRAEVWLEQSPRTAHRRQLVVEAHDDGVARALDGIVSAAQSEFPGVAVTPRGARSYEIVIPAALDGGHEAHFALVLDEFLRAIDDGRWPAAVAARTLAKYAVLAEAAAATGSPARSPR
jgi:predicted dehydrogenase